MSQEDETFKNIMLYGMSYIVDGKTIKPTQIHMLSPEQMDRQAAAVRTLEHAKYTYQDGAYLWKPPIGKSPFIQQEWQPISTAPKQAGLILLSDGYTTEAGSWYEEYGWMARREIYHPTHWMTLPLPAHKD